MWSNRYSIYTDFREEEKPVASERRTKKGGPISYSSPRTGEKKSENRGRWVREPEKDLENSYRGGKT